MGTTLDCPSCGTGLHAGASMCGSCGVSIGQCPACRAPGVVGIQCLECEKAAVTARRTATKVRKAPGDKSVPLAFSANALGLLPYVAIRLALGAVFLAALLLGLKAAGVVVVEKVTVHFDPKLDYPLPVWGGIVAGTGLLLGIVNTLIRRWRIHHTRVYGERAAYRPGVVTLAGNLILNTLFLTLTAGLALPWIFARNRRSFYRNCLVPGHANRKLDFEPSGDEMLGYCFLTLVLAPLVLASAGLLRPFVAWMWVKWEQRNLVIPGAYGQMQRVRFVGTLPGYLGRGLLGWILTILTAGIYRPWALVAEWRWIAAQSRTK